MCVVGGRDANLRSVVFFCLDHNELGSEPTVCR